MRVISIDVGANPEEIARALRRELGSALCRRIGRALVEERFVIINMRPNQDRQEAAVRRAPGGE